MTPPFDRHAGARLWGPPLLLLLLGAALTMPGLGDSGLWDPWEPRYAQAARETAERGSWLAPYYRGDPRFVKPPLTYALIGLSQAAGGVDEAASRFPSALLATLCAAGLGLALASRGRPLEGLLAGGALLTAPQWLLLGRFATPDIPFAALVGGLVAVAIAFPAVRERRTRAALGVLAVLLLAAATLTEWTRGLVVPAWGAAVWTAMRFGWTCRAIVALSGILFFVAQRIFHGPLNVVSFLLLGGVALWGLRRGAGVPVRVLVAGAIVVALLLAPWFVAIFAEHPEEAAERQLGYKHPLNLGETPGLHTGPLYYPLWIAAVGGLPWTALAAVGLVHGLRRRTAAGDPASILAAAWLGSLLFFTLSESRMGHFYGVLQPAMAGLAAVGLVETVRRRGWRPAAAGVVLVALAGLVVADPRVLLETATVKRQLHGLFDPVPVFLVCLGAWTLPVVLAVARRRPGWALPSIVPAAVLVGVLGMVMVPALEQKKSVRPMWRAYLAQREADQPIAGYGSTIDSWCFYSDNAIGSAKKTRRSLRDYLLGGGTRYLILRQRDRAVIEPENLGVPGRWERIDETHPTHWLLRFVPGEPADPGTSGEEQDLRNR